MYHIVANSLYTSVSNQLLGEYSVDYNNSKLLIGVQLGVLLTLEKTI